MGKNWLIRTKSNHILGPISKEKVLELYNNGSIKADDEICSGNGYWFYVRETDLVQKFLIGKEPQGFNPMSEAKNVLTSLLESNAESQIMKQDDITVVGGINLKELSLGDERKNPPEPEKSSPQDMPMNISSEDAEYPDLPQAEEKKKSKKSRLEAVSPVPFQTPKESNWQSFLKPIGIVIFIIIFLLIYFRKSIYRNVFYGKSAMTSNIWPINTANAQSDSLDKKKN